MTKLLLLRLIMRLEALEFQLNVAGSSPGRLFYITPEERLRIEEEISIIAREIQGVSAVTSGAWKEGPDCSNDAAIADALGDVLAREAVTQDEDANFAAALSIQDEALEQALKQALEQAPVGKDTCPCCRCEIEVPPGWRNCGWFVHGAIVTHRGGRFEEVQVNQHLTPAAREDLKRAYPQLPPLLSDRRDGVPYLAGCLSKLFLTENGFVKQEE